ncbi:MAG: PAS domain-containing protein, partial [Thermoguttaceae bacterium]|nr:PAS domain-containing protein [Thermoguttaceae bacterium]
HYGVKTSLTLPLTAGGGSPLGALSFNTVRGERTWPEPIVKRLQLIAQIFTNALARKRSDEMLRESEERLSIAADSADAGLWNYNISTGRYWLTEKTRELFGFQVDEDVTFDRFLALVHPDDRDLVRTTMQAVMHSKSEGRVEYRVLRADGNVTWFVSRGRASCRRASSSASAQMMNRRQASVTLRTCTQPFRHQPRSV